MRLLSPIEMNSLTTERLLAYRNALLSVPEKPDWDESVIWEESALNKTSPAWKETFAELKKILSQRPNIPRPRTIFDEIDELPIIQVPSPTTSVSGRQYDRVLEDYRLSAKKQRSILISSRGVEDHRNGKHGKKYDVYGHEALVFAVKLAAK